MSQLDLACDAEISTRHLSCLETSSTSPSREMALHLAACLEIPLRDRNILLGAAGFAPLFQERSFNEPAFGMVRRNVEIVLAAYDPYPALAVDRHWTMLAANRAVAHLVAGADLTLLRPPVNVLRLSLHPAGLASRIVNLAQWRAHVIARLRREIDISGDAVLMDLLEELRDYPNPRGPNPRGPNPRGPNPRGPDPRGPDPRGPDPRGPDPRGPDPRGESAQDAAGMLAIPFRLATIDGVLSFYSTTTLFGTPVDITVAELAIEAFLPADAETAAVLRRAADRGETRQEQALLVS